VTYIIAISIPILILGGFIYSSFFRHIRDTTAQSNVEKLYREHRIHEANVYQMQRIVNQMFLSRQFSPFYLFSGQDRALVLMREIVSLVQINPFIEEIIIHYRGDDFAFSSRSSHRLDMLFSNAFIFEHLSEEEMLEILLTSNEHLVLPANHIDTQFTQLFSDYLKGEFVTFVYQIPPFAREPFATVMFLIPQQVYEETFTPYASAPSDTYIFWNDVLITRTNTAETDIKDVLVYADASKDQWHVRDSEGRMLLVTALNGEFSNMRYFNIVPLDDVLSPLRREQVVFMFLTILILVVCGFLSVFFVRINYKPIKVIGQAIQARANANNTPKSELQSIHAGIDALYKSSSSLLVEAELGREARKNVLFIDMLKGNFSDPVEPYSLCAENGIDVFRPYYNIMMLRLPAGNTRRESGLNKFCAGLDSENKQVHCINLITSIVFISFFNNAQDATETQEQLQLFFSQRKIKGVIGISAPHVKVDTFPVAFEEAFSASLMKHAEVDVELITQEKCARLNLKEYPLHMINEFEHALLSMQMERIDDVLTHISEYIAVEHLPDSIIQLIIGDLKSILFKRLLKMDLVADIHNELFRKFFSSFPTWEEVHSDIIEICQTLANAMQRPETNTDSAFAKEILKYIQENYLDPSFSLYATADKYFITASKLTALIKNELNVSPSKYISHAKIEKAKIMLIETDYSVNDICAELGYNSVTTFINKFKSATGLSPQVYRKQNSKE